jgi:hypothetical protein
MSFAKSSLFKPMGMKIMTFLKVSFIADDSSVLPFKTSYSTYTYIPPKDWV